MKYLFFSLFSFFAISVTAQTNQLNNQLNEVQKLISSFSENKDTQLLTDAGQVLGDILKDPKNAKNPKIQLSQAQLLTLQLEHQEQDAPMTTCANIHQAYNTALTEDTRMTLRHQILGDIYTSKILMMQKGNTAYEDKDYKTAHSFYSQLIKLNDLEVTYPRYARVDTSLMFTSAVYATLAKKTDVAISSFEKLVDMDYNRKDMYTYLQQLYTEKKQPEKAEQIIEAMKKRFGEE